MNRNVICDYLWQASKFDGDLLFSVISLAERSDYYSATFLLLSVVEKMCARADDDYNSNFQKVLWDLLNKKIISEAIYMYLNGSSDTQVSIRYLRNVMVHKDLYSFIVLEHNDKRELFYPLSESDSWKAFYDGNANILFNIIYVLVFEDDKIAKNIDDILSKNCYSCLTLMLGNNKSNIEVIS